MSWLTMEKKSQRRSPNIRKQLRVCQRTPPMTAWTVPWGPGESGPDEEGFVPSRATWKSMKFALLITTLTALVSKYCEPYKVPLDRQLRAKHSMVLHTKANRGENALPLIELWWRIESTFKQMTIRVEKLKVSKGAVLNSSTTKSILVVWKVHSVATKANLEKENQLY